MNLKKTTGIISIVIFAVALNFSLALGASPQPPCVPQVQIIKLLELIPQSFPIGKKDNVFVIDKTSGGSLTVTIDGLHLRFFDTRDSDNRKWGSVANSFKKDALEADLSRLGCVIAGINNYDKGTVDKSKGALTLAQKTFNEYVLFTQGLVKN